MTFAHDDRFYKRLHPRDHLKREDGGWRVTSAAFRRRRTPTGWISSVDWAARISLDGERELRDRVHPGWGIGVFSYADAEEAGAGIEHDPEHGNDAHCSVHVGPGRAEARDLAKRVSVVDLPE